MSAIYFVIIGFSKEFQKSREIANSILEAFIIFLKSSKNSTRALAPISLIISFFLLIARDLPFLQLFQFRITYVCLVYSVFVIIGMAYEVIKKDGTMNNALLTTTLTIILGILQTTRFFIAIFISLIITIPLSIKGFSILTSFLISLPISLSAKGGFAINDYYDFKRDYLNKPYRAIPSGKLSRETVLWLGIVLLISSFILSIFLSKTFFQFALYIFTFLGVVFYNYIVKRYAISKTIFAASLCVTPLLLVIQFLDNSAIIYLLPLSGLLYITGRELLMDALDIKGDRNSGIITLPILLGEKKTVSLAFFAQFFSILILSPILVFSNSLLLYVVYSLLVLHLLITFFLWDNSNKIYQSLLIKTMWLQFILSISFLLI